MEYTVHLADLKISNVDGSIDISVIWFEEDVVLFESDSVALAITKAQDLSDDTGNCYVVFQQRHKYFRGYGF